MDFANTNFVIGQVAGSSPNGTMEMASVLMHNSNNNNNNSEILDKEKYKKYKIEEKNYIFYKKINFEFKKSFKVKLITVSLHFGDVIDFITRHTGIKKLIMWATNGNCGCEARRVKFNEWFKIPLIFFKLDSFNYADYIDIKKQNKNINNDPSNKKLYTSYAEYKKNLIQEENNILIHNVINKNFEKGIMKLPTGIKEPMVLNPTNTPPTSGCGCGSKKKNLTVTKTIV